MRGRSYAPDGKAPATFAVGGTRQKLPMIATVTNRGKTRRMVIDEALNPEERLNADPEQTIYTMVPVRTKAKPKAAATENMQNLQKLPERVKKQFRYSRVKYAA